MKKLSTSAAFLFYIMILFCSSASAQKRSAGHLGIRASASISANRFGVIYSPSLFYRNNKNVISFGATMQKDKNKISGWQLSIERTLLDPSGRNDCYIDWLELYAFANAGYHNNAFLGKSVCEEEAAANPEFKVSVTERKLKAIDAYAGFGVRIILLRNLKWFNAIGMGGYSVLNSPEELYYNPKGLGIVLRTGISYQFERKHKVKY